ncbi:MAG: hypothetical protein ACYDH4_10900 [Candidatus Cryosericum sp.]
MAKDKTVPVMPEEQRQALLRFAAFESEKLEAADDTTILMMQLALYKLFERNPKRVGAIIASALAIYGGNDPGMADLLGGPLFRPSRAAKRP